MSRKANLRFIVAGVIVLALLTGASLTIGGGLLKPSPTPTPKDAGCDPNQLPMCVLPVKDDYGLVASPGGTYTLKIPVGIRLIAGQKPADLRGIHLLNSTGGFDMTPWVIAETERLDAGQQECPPTPILRACSTQPVDFAPLEGAQLQSHPDTEGQPGLFIVLAIRVTGGIGTFEFHGLELDYSIDGVPHKAFYDENYEICSTKSVSASC